MTEGKKDYGNISILGTLKRLIKGKEKKMIKLIPDATTSKVTRKVFKDFNRLSELKFINKYSCTKNTYLKRVIKYGDPYMNSPISKLFRLLAK